VLLFHNYSCFYFRKRQNDISPSFASLSLSLSLIKVAGMNPETHIESVQDFHAEDHSGLLWNWNTLIAKKPKTLLLYIENNCIIMIYIIKYTKNLLFFNAGWYCLLGQTLSQTQTSGSVCSQFCFFPPSY
jgi:hypothetical protein